MILMRKLSIPDINGVDILKLCALSIRDVDLKNKLLKVEAQIQGAEAEYVARGQSGEFHLIKEANSIGLYLSGKQMERVYNGTFVKSEKTRRIYSMLKKACVNDICPLCGQGTVHQLDHFLPITQFPALGITAVNLIPACSDCNKLKLAHAPKSPSDQTIHPYFDEFDHERWLYAVVVESSPPALIFSVKAPGSWSKVKVDRMKTHFRIFKLGALYATHAAVEINNMRYMLNKISESSSSLQGIRAYLIERSESCAQVYQNSWQRATFDALANSDWFCSEGFNVK